MCLSYTWQPEKPRQDIEVNGCVLSVGQNLFQFLQAYRRYQVTEKASPLWIDAICINQDDLVEKGHQVQRMGSIYRSSGKVLIWPGKLSSDILEMLRERQILPAAPRIDEATTLEVLNSSIVPSDNFLNTQIAAFWSLPYWDRLWIVQEILSGGGRGERVNVLLEEVLVDLVDLGRKLGKKDLMMSTSHAEFQSLSIGERFAYWRAALNWRETTPKDLEVYISEFRHQKCQNTCDRVYGLLALSTDQLIEVDYQAGPINLFCHYLDRHMHRKAIDELLVLGATLIEALEISSELAPEQVKSTKISSPVWREGELEIYDFGSDATSRNQRYVKRMLCIFVTVRDAQDIHIFEYAVEESEVDTSVTVRYARAYEFVSGQPNGLRHRGHVAEIEKGNPRTKNDWLNKPSEDILYCRNFSGQASLASPPLWEWTVADDVSELVDTSSVTPNGEKSQLSLGRRYWLPEQVLVIARPDDLECIKFEPFMGMAMYVGQELVTAVDESMMLEVPQSRGTLLRDHRVPDFAAILQRISELGL